MVNKITIEIYNEPDGVRMSFNFPDGPLDAVVKEHGSLENVIVHLAKPENKAKRTALWERLIPHEKCALTCFMEMWKYSEIK